MIPKSAKFTLESSLSEGIEKALRSDFKDNTKSILNFYLPKPKIYSIFLKAKEGLLGIMFAIYSKLIGCATQVPLILVWGQNIYCGIPYSEFLSLKFKRA